MGCGFGYVYTVLTRSDEIQKIWLITHVCRILEGISYISEDPSTIIKYLASDDLYPMRHN